MRACATHSVRAPSAAHTVFLCLHNTLCVSVCHMRPLSKQENYNSDTAASARGPGSGTGSAAKAAQVQEVQYDSIQDLIHLCMCVTRTHTHTHCACVQYTVCAKQCACACHALFGTPTLVYLGLARQHSFPGPPLDRLMLDATKTYRHHHSKHVFGSHAGDDTESASVSATEAIFSV